MVVTEVDAVDSVVVAEVDVVAAVVALEVVTVGDAAVDEVNLATYSGSEIIRRLQNRTLICAFGDINTVTNRLQIDQLLF